IEVDSLESTKVDLKPTPIKAPLPTLPTPVVSTADLPTSTAKTDNNIVDKDLSKVETSDSVTETIAEDLEKKEIPEIVIEEEYADDFEDEVDSKESTKVLNEQTKNTKMDNNLLPKPVAPASLPSTRILSPRV